MKYRELFHFEALEQVVQLRDADTRDGATRLVSTYVLSAEVAECLTGVVFPSLQIDRPADNKGLLVVGNHGTGKSHLLAFISSLAEYADLAETIANPELLRPNEAAETKGHVRVDAFAGCFKVIRVEIEKTSKPLREMLLGRIEEYLASQSVSYSFASDASASGKESALDQMMAAFHEKFPQHGLLVVVDELLDYLRTRTDQELIPDLDFLSEMGAVCQRSRFRFVAGVEEPILDTPRVGLATDSLNRVKSRFAQVVIPANALRAVISERLARKTPTQKAQVQQYLSGFSRFYGRMNERMGEFVALFPIHPDYIEVCDKLTFTEERELLRTLSDETKKLLDEPVPQDRPGLIAYDSYWDKLRGTPAFQEVHDVEAVIESTLALQNRIENSAIDTRHKALAVRLLHALAVHRLTTGDIYSKLGPTPAELRDKLCLYHPAVEEMGSEPADDLLLLVIAILEMVKKIGGDKFVSFDPGSDHYYLHFTRFRRFLKPEILLHWVNAVPFIMLMITGGVMLASRFWHIDHHAFARVVLTHKVFASLWAVGLPLVLCLRPRVHWMHIRLMLRWGHDDLLWLIQSVRSSFDKQAVVPPAGRFNTGQKINACLVLVYFVGFATTGILIHFKGTMLFPWYVHTALFCASMNTVGGHLFLALFNASTRISLPGIFHGWSPMEYIEHHHPLSLPRSRQSHVQPVDARKVVGEIFGTRVQVIMLVVSLAMAAVGAMAFHKGMMTSAQVHFEKKFSALISPRQLSTKHRMGASSERCTKCHSYTGRIPDRNCEQCHLVVKEHRAKGLGYHGTLKGDCIACHKEHPAGTNSLIPLIRETFRHSLAGFELEGKHTKLDCDECHIKKRPADAPGIYYLGLKHDSCADCHQGPHGHQFTTSCEKCHSAKGWAGSELKFSHAVDSAFKLADKHSAVDCRKCHKPATQEASLGSAVFKGLPQDCKACHQDPHGQQFTAACTSCHSPAGWKKDELHFDHNKDAKFALVAKHADVACEKCHPPRAAGGPLASAQFHGLKSECADCHKDPHRQQFAAACTACHSPAGWKRDKLRFDHNKDAKFTLVAKHADALCEKCHLLTAPGQPLASAQLHGLPAECADCHKDPHNGQFERACTKCHVVPVAWSVKTLQFEHGKDTKFPLLGRHAAVDCNKCHKPRPAGGPLASAAFKGLATDCETCHKVKHPQEYGSRCVSCHNNDRWPKQHPGVEHIWKYETNGEHLAGKHLTAKCNECHQVLRIAVLKAGGRPRIECTDCHKLDDPHKGGLGSNCIKCHGMEGWKGEHLRFTHDSMTRFGLDADHRRTACSKCHDSVNWKTKGTTCADCHPKFYAPRK